MSSVVLDASVLIAIIRKELSEESILDLLAIGTISTVNLAEVLTRVGDLGLSTNPDVLYLISLLNRVEPFSVKQAAFAAQMRDTTRHAGLSLGDRACLALALDLGLPAYTVDRAWLRVDVGCPIHCLR